MDHNATTPVSPEVIEAMYPYFRKIFGNASSVHFFGREAKKGLNNARKNVAELIKCSPEEIIFTSGGTEADNLAIFGIMKANRKKGKHIITSQIEHHAILNSCKILEQEGYEVTYLPVDKYGIIDLEELKYAIRADTVLISIMAANNEIGTIEPIDMIGQVAHEHGIIFHTDAVQAAGKFPIDVNKMNIDLLSMSGHKLYGPKGVGALFIGKNIVVSPLQYGGHHEHNLRAGTENISGIIGFAKACEIAKRDMEIDNNNIFNLKKKLYNAISKSIPEVLFNGHTEKCLAGTLNVCFKYIEGESILLSLDNEGIAASTGSACSSKSLEPSHVLLAIGIQPEMAHGSIRFSLGKENTEDEIDYVINKLPDLIEKLRNMSPLYNKQPS
ncbi:cysteine desulfurase NifS [Candidatus Desantisbacteria bacterium]|nr:cysteine desulfurase NifS [Candidatus Desantisbacteria bacterium]